MNNSLATLCVLFVLALGACKKKDTDTTILYKVTCTTCLISYVDREQTQHNDTIQNAWEHTFEGRRHKQTFISATTGTLNGFVHVWLYADGELKGEGEDTGIASQASATYQIP